MIVWSLRCIIIIASIVKVAIPAIAAPTTEELAVTSYIEESVVKRYRERISTRVSNDLFFVSAQVSLMEKPKEENEKNKTLNQSDVNYIPDFNLGLLTQVSSSMSQDGNPQKFLEKYKLRRVNVFVGLSHLLDDDYKNKFQEWLTQSVRSEFGPIANSFVNTIPKAPKEKPEVTPDKELDKELGKEKKEPPTLLEKLGQFQHAVGLAILSLFVIFAVLLYKLLPSIDAKNKNKLTKEISEIESIKLAAQNSIRSPEPVNSEIIASPEQTHEIELNPVVYESFKSHQNKIAFLVNNRFPMTLKLFTLWSGEGAPGKLKITATIDALLSVSEKISSMNTDFSFENLLPDSLKNDREMTKAFKSYSKLSSQKRMEILEKSYWDIVSHMTMKEQALYLPFSKMKDSNLRDIKKIIKEQNNQLKMITVLHLESEQMTEVLRDFPLQEKINMFKEAYVSERVEPEVIEFADSSINFLLNNSSHQIDDKISMQGFLPQMLINMRASEEVKLILEISNELSDKGNYIRFNYPSIAFLGEWPKDELKKLIAKLSVRQLQAILQILPNQALIIITEQLPTRLKSILRDTTTSKKLSNEELDVELSRVRSTLFTMFENKNIDLNTLFSTEPSQVLHEVA